MNNKEKIKYLLKRINLLEEAVFTLPVISEPVHDYEPKPTKDEAYYEKFIGRKVKGFKFSHDEICYPSVMKDYEGKLGIILEYGKNVNNYYVKFEDDYHSYPADMVIERLEPEEETFEVGQPVWVRDEEGDVWNLRYYIHTEKGRHFCVLFNRYYEESLPWELVKPFKGIDPNSGIKYD